MAAPHTHGDRLTSHQGQPSAGQLISAVTGTLYLVVGLFGFMTTGSSEFTGHDPTHVVVGLTVNPLHNVLHLVVGALGIAAFAAPGLARLYGVFLFVAYGVLFVWGTGAAGGPNALNLDWGGNVLHGATAALGALVALLPVRRHRADSARGER